MKRPASAPRLVLLLGQRDGEREQVIGREAGIDDADALVAANQQAGADQQDHGERHLADDERLAQTRARRRRPSRARPSRRIAPPPRPVAISARDETEDHARQHRDRDGEREHPPVEIHFAETRNAGRSERDQRPRGPVGDDEPPPRRRPARGRCFRRENCWTRRRRPAPSAARNRHFRGCGRWARRQQQVGDVDAGDQQHEGDRGRAGSAAPDECCARCDPAARSRSSRESLLVRGKSRDRRSATTAIAPLRLLENRRRA